MLKFANFYEDDLKIKFADIAHDERFMWVSGSTHRSVYEASTSTWDKLEMVSVSSDGTLIGYLKYSINREIGDVYGVQIVNFLSFEKSSYKIQFGKDVDKFLRDIFEKFKHRKLSFSVFVGNPIEKTYDKMIEKLGGRIVGIREDESKLLDGNIYSLKLYEVLSKNYIPRKQQNNKEMKENIMNRIELDQHSQDIILACKGRYREDGKSPFLEGIKKAVANIIGYSVEDVELWIVNNWMYDVYMELLNTDGTCVHQSDLKDHLMGNSFDQRHYKDRAATEQTYWFLKGQIQGCRCHADDYELVLNLNEKIATELDFINEESRRYDVITPDSPKENSPYTFTITLEGDNVEDITNDNWMDGYRESQDRVKKLATETVTGK